MEIPIDLLKKMILETTQGMPFDGAVALSGFHSYVVREAFLNEVGYDYDEYRQAAGVAGHTLSPYYDNIAMLPVTFAIRNRVLNEIQEYLDIAENVTVGQNDSGIWINDSCLNTLAFHSFDKTRPNGVLFIAVNGLYPDEIGELHEVDLYLQLALDDESYGDYILTETEHDPLASMVFKHVFKTVENSYRV